MQFGVWLPVYGGWLRVTDQSAEPDVANCLDIAKHAEGLGFDFLYASENLLNCIHGPEQAVADAWSMLSAVAATTESIGLCGAIKPGFRSPILVARMLDTLTKIARRPVAMNIVCGWWKTEFDVSGVDWLDHRRRYDRAEAFLRSIDSLFHPPVGMSTGELAARIATASSGEQSGSEDTEIIPTFGFREGAMPEVWVAGHSDRAVNLVAERGDCLFVNGMNDDDLVQQIQAVRREASKRGREVSIAANAYVLGAESSDEAKRRAADVVSKRNIDTIAFFRGVMDQSGGAAWADLEEEQMVDSNAGFELGLVGSFEEIQARIGDLAEMGINRIICQFDDPMRDAELFMKRVVRPLRSGWWNPSPATEAGSNSIRNLGM
ncbi:LLM class flavin-dependent oxidoreductase [Methyloligella halotolerans]|nr:LLM class flavin-dependent oxidoreductase [Methyloligella halotolerans]